VLVHTIGRVYSSKARLFLQKNDMRHLGGAGEAMRAPERAMLLQALEACGWNRTLAARRLGINRSTLYRKLRDLGLDAHRDAC